MLGFKKNPQHFEIFSVLILEQSNHQCTKLLHLFLYNYSLLQIMSVNEIDNNNIVP